MKTLHEMAGLEYKEEGEVGNLEVDAEGEVTKEKGAEEEEVVEEKAEEVVEEVADEVSKEDSVEEEEGREGEGLKTEGGEIEAEKVDEEGEEDQDALGDGLQVVRPPDIETSGIQTEESLESGAVSPTSHELSRARLYDNDHNERHVVLIIRRFLHPRVEKKLNTEDRSGRLEKKIEALEARLEKMEEMLETLALHGS